MNCMHSQLTVVLGLVERDHKILIARRFDPEHPQWHHRWEIPGGKIKPGETPLKALHREIYEETQLTIISASLLGIHTHHWHTPKGVQQTFMLVYHCATDRGEVVLSPDENDAFAWEPVDQIILNPDMLEGTAAMLQSLVIDTHLHHRLSLVP